MNTGKNAVRPHSNGGVLAFGLGVNGSDGGAVETWLMRWSGPITLRSAGTQNRAVSACCDEDVASPNRAQACLQLDGKPDEIRITGRQRGHQHSFKRFRNSTNSSPRRQLVARLLVLTLAHRAIRSKRQRNSCWLTREHWSVARTTDPRARCRPI